MINRGKSLLDISNSPVNETDTLLIKCCKHVNNANNRSGPDTATAFQYYFIALNKAWFTLQLTHTHSLLTKLSCNIIHVYKSKISYYSTQSPKF